MADGREWPGGAPANVAFHAAHLRATAMMVSRTGDDARGSVLRAWLAGAGVGVEAVSTGAPAPTGCVGVAEGPEGPVYDIKAPAAWDFLEAGPAAGEAVRGVRVLELCASSSAKRYGGLG